VSENHPTHPRGLIVQPGRGSSEKGGTSKRWGTIDTPSKLGKDGAG